MAIWLSDEGGDILELAEMLTQGLSSYHYLVNVSENFIQDTHTLSECW